MNLSIPWHGLRLGLLGFWVGAALYVQLRGRERHGLLRSLISYDTVLAPYNALMVLFSSVPRRPFLELSRFPELEPLREHWEEIRDEARQLQRAGLIRRADGTNDLAFHSFFKRRWKRFYFKWYGDPLPSARELCPRTTALIESIPSVQAAMFTLLAPDSKLMRHRDPFAGALRYHLGLITPGRDGCRIEVDGHSYSWRDGEAVLFDQTFIHRALNDTDQDRIILFCDVTRPLHFAPLAALNGFVIRHLAAASASRNRADEQVGLLNRLFARVYGVRPLAKRLKHFHRGLYYTLKLGVFFGLVYLVFVGG